VIYCVYIKKCHPDFDYFIGSSDSIASKTITSTPTEHTCRYNDNSASTWTCTTYDHKMV